MACRRDPEDGYGWRLTGRGEDGFGDAAAAEAAALTDMGWGTA
ncbi:MAG: hypothetical protein ACU0DW_10100 [Shimia sp.]